jgi:hypothetical protein
LDAVDSSRQSDIGAINRILQDIVGEAEEFLSQMSEHDRQTWFHMTSWFLTAPAFCYLLENSGSAEEFAANYSGMRAMTMATLDFFAEFDEYRRIRSVSTAP